MASVSQDWIAALAEALWPHLEKKLAPGQPDADGGSASAALNRQDAAQYLGMTANALRKRNHLLLRSRRFPGYARPLYLRRDLDEWLALGERDGGVK